MGSLDEKGLSQTTEKLIRTIRQYLSPDTINALINPYRRQLEWFFAAFPNRFLLSSSSAILAQQMMRFENWSSEATVSVLTNPRGRPVGLLVYVREAPQIHSRIAYALSRQQINIEGAKMNRVCFCRWSECLLLLPPDHGSFFGNDFPKGVGALDSLRFSTSIGPGSTALSAQSTIAAGVS
jgi:hypothetical protein